MSKRFMIIFGTIELVGLIVTSICNVIQTAREKEMAKIIGREAGKAILKYSDKVMESEAEKA